MKIRVEHMNFKSPDFDAVTVKMYLLSNLSFDATLWLLSTRSVLQNYVRRPPFDALRSLLEYITSDWLLSVIHTSLVKRSAHLRAYFTCFWLPKTAHARMLHLRALMHCCQSVDNLSLSCVVSRLL